MRNPKMKQVKPDEKGFASIVIALVLIIVLSLITLGFAQLARREQQSALDKQLSIQAYYAAESGVNDAVDLLKAGTLPNSPNNCLDLTSLGHNKLVNPGADVSYSCVLTQLSPPSVVYSGVGVNASRSLTFSTTGALDQITVNWGSDDGQTTPKPCCDLLPMTTATGVGSWTGGGHPAVLQFSITPLNDLSRNGLIKNTFTAYLYPSPGGAATVAYDPSPAGQAPVVPGNCGGSGAYPCHVTINSLGGVAGESYLVHVLVYYDQTNININNAKDIPGSLLSFVDGQAQIDVTGRAKNVLKRIQVRVPIHPRVTLPSQAIEAQSICKRAKTAPGTLSNPTGTSFDTIIDSSGTNTCDVAT